MFVACGLYAQVCVRTNMFGVHAHVCEYVRVNLQSMNQSSDFAFPKGSQFYLSR